MHQLAQVAGGNAGGSGGSDDDDPDESDGNPLGPDNFNMANFDEENGVDDPDFYKKSVQIKSGRFF